MSIKPYFWLKDIYDVKPNELETTAELDELEATAKPDEVEAPLFTLEVPKELTKSVELITKCDQGCP
jgi:hypothetical protein